MTYVTASQSSAAWTVIYQSLARYQQGTRVSVPKTDIPHPVEAGALPSLGWPVGQSADYRFPPDANRQGFHVQDFGDQWVAHIDQVHPASDLIEHAREDAPQAWLLGGAVIGAAIGATFVKTRQATTAGALIGLAAALLTAHTPEE